MVRRRPTQEEIAQRAYELYQQRGHRESEALNDWLEAEAELEAAELAAESGDALRAGEARASGKR